MNFDAFKLLHYLAFKILANVEFPARAAINRISLLKVLVAIGSVLDRAFLMLVSCSLPALFDT